MRIAVITPYYKEATETLQRCARSVAGQTHGNVHHVFVSDGFPNPAVDALPGATHIRVPNHADYGDTPRAIGALHAVNQGYDGVAFLDADNWYEPQHVELLLRNAQATGAVVSTASRTLWSEDGQDLGPCTESDGVNHVDTNCFLILPPAYKLLGAWGFKDPNQSIYGDLVFWRAVKAAGVGHTHCATPTVNYTTNFAAHWLRLGATPPATSKVNVRLPNGTMTQISYALWTKLQEIA